MVGVDAQCDSPSYHVGIPVDAQCDSPSYHVGISVDAQCDSPSYHVSISVDAQCDSPSYHVGVSVDPQCDSPSYHVGVPVDGNVWRRLVVVGTKVTVGGAEPFIEPMLQRVVLGAVTQVPEQRNQYKFEFKSTC